MRVSNSLAILITICQLAACGSAANGHRADPTAPALDAAPAFDAALSAAAPGPTPPEDLDTPPAGAHKTSSGLFSVVLQPGTGSARRPQPQDQLEIRLVGWTRNGQLKDLSQRGPLARFTLGRGGGLTEGLALMVVGEKRRFWVSRDLAARYEFPANLPVFDVELVELIPGPAPIVPPVGLDTPPRDAVRDPKHGLTWKITRKGTGTQRPSAKATASFAITAWVASGSILLSDHVGPRRGALQGIPRTWQRMLPQMVVGETRVVWVRNDPSFSGFTGVKRGDVIVQQIELVDFVEPLPAADLASPPADAEALPDGLHSKRLVAGAGAVHPGADDVVEIRYSGWTDDGSLIDSTVLLGRPVRLSPKLGHRIPGWVEGSLAAAVQVMVVGEKRRFWIPAAPPLPPGPVQDRPRPHSGKRVFEIELVAINPAPPTP